MSNPASQRTLILRRSAATRALPAVLNGLLDAFARPTIRVLRTSYASFKVLGAVGLGTAMLLALVLCLLRGLSLWLMGGISILAVAILFGLTIVTKIVTAKERIINYHHQIVVCLGTVLLVRSVGHPVLPYLDITMLSVGLFIAWGRLGCLMAGCCYGRIHVCGVRYGKQHAVGRVAPHLIGVRLFPVQALSSLWVFACVGMGIILVVKGAEPGEAFVWYAVAYSGGRFCFEFLRGDLERSIYAGFSEAQWTALFVVGVVVWMEVLGALPFHPRHAMVGFALLAAMPIVAARRGSRKGEADRLLQPGHIREVADAVDRLSLTANAITPSYLPSVLPPTIGLECTSLGIQISAGSVRHSGETMAHFAISRMDGGLSAAAAHGLARVILHLRYPSGLGELMTGNREVFHLLIHKSHDREDDHLPDSPRLVNGATKRAVGQLRT